MSLWPAGLKTCQKERLAALAWSGSAPAGVFVPQCTNDGEYKLSQCAPSGDYCWCVDQNGKPIPRTLSTDKIGCADTGLSLLTLNKPYLTPIITDFVKYCPIGKRKQEEPLMNIGFIKEFWKFRYTLNERQLTAWLYPILYFDPLFSRQFDWMSTWETLCCW